jgi:type II secretory pathway pseudopilin PulG
MKKTKTSKCSKEKSGRISVMLVALAIVANLALLMPPVALAAAGLTAAEREELEAQLEEARAQLDEAAERMGELHSRLYAMETVGQHGQKPMLGVLVGERGPNGGLLLSGVTPGGGAEAAGMRAGDEITSVNNVDLTDARSAMAQLKAAMSDVAPGDAVSVGYQRDGGFQLADVTTQAKGVFIMGMTGAPAIEVEVEALENMAISVSEHITSSGEWVSALESLENLESLEALQALESLESLEALAPQMHAGVHKAIRIAGPGGLRLESVAGDLATYFGVESGVLVLAAPDGPNGEPGPLKAGDVLLAVDGEPIRNPGDGFRTLMGGQHAADGGNAELTVEVMRQGVREFVMLTPSQIGGGASSISIRSTSPGEVDVEVVAPPVPNPPGP